MLYRATETLRWLSILLYPVMPEAAQNISRQIGSSDDISKIDPAGLKWGDLAAGTRIGETVGVFPRIDKSKVMNEIKNEPATLSATSNALSEPPASAGGTNANEEQAKTEEDSFITIDDFIKVELRVGEIKVARSVLIKRA